MSMMTDMESLKVNYQKGKDLSEGVFILEPLSPGYGQTIGHALRRVLLSSLTGAAIYSVKIEGVSHEFSTLNGIKEDIVDIILNLKSLRLRLEGDEPTVIKLDKKGPGVIKAKDFQNNPLVKIADLNHHIASLDKNGKLVLEATVKKGFGYEPVERRKDEKLPLGTIAIDSIFSPVKKINYEVENTRVGQMTNYDKLTLEITTDGSISVEEAFNSALKILIDHFTFIQSKIEKVKPKSEKKEVVESEVKKEKTKTATKKTAVKKEKPAKKRK
ncbi:DNA-directed RNA polymerase subunit alpha [Candidatus Berkelbacteria bacterium RIFCSPHIGHO2_12_FULL_36_9]|uniref:DNA-directed RNA polymerase subunit alpha n=1 Tax=Candidatus Berkelbacteria bacterium RIFCSPHIGHO2_12_FULL_36_9 TaxID=1797469 RepID=A0A1F5EKT4_9BACT|nr:MAG: DNA-directed RNA polymerase subunit alpha [Candidatus Berkelbacteria bacterium RIFCSPHIGHO2_12_FULL_36_9]